MSMTMRYLLVLVVTSLCACQTVYRENSPDVVYSQQAEDARSLQVPPDLTDVSDAEQFVLPGNSREPVRRNTLLPLFESVRSAREGDQLWLELNQSAESLWPVLQSFLRESGYPIERAEPLVGVIASEWQALDETSGGLLGGLIGGEEQFERIAFRLERSESGSRLFARAQLASADELEALDQGWSESSYKTDTVSELMSRLLLYVGLEEQRVKGLLSDEQASAMRFPAEIQSTVAGSQLVVHRGFGTVFQALNDALLSLDYTLGDVDRGVGQIQAIQAAAGEQGSDEAVLSEAELAARTVLVDINPVNISAAVVTLARSEGQTLEPDQEQAMLESLLSAVNAALPG